MSHDFYRGELIAADARMHAVLDGLADLLGQAKAADTGSPADYAMILAIAGLMGQARGSCLTEATRRRYEAEEQA